MKITVSGAGIHAEFHIQIICRLGYTSYSEDQYIGTLVFKKAVVVSLPKVRLLLNPSATKDMNDVVFPVRESRVPCKATSSQSQYWSINKVLRYSSMSIIVRQSGETNQ